jgi:phage/plasmid-like protein (TIGR03299 family)
MPAEIDTMFSVREMPWHHQGVVPSDYPGSWAEARRLAGLDWEPVLEEVYVRRGVDDEGQPLFIPVPDWQSIYRSDTNQVLWINRESYQLIDHHQMGEIVEAVLTLPGVKWETAGSLDDGRAVWCLALLDEPITLPGDDSTVTLPYMAMTNRHGIPGACTLRATAVRIVCANTFQAAELEGESTGTTFSFAHRTNWRNRLDEARQAITGVRQEMNEYAQLARQLLDIPITPRQRERFVAEFIPMPPDGLVTDRVVRNVDEARKALRAILTSDTTAAVADTGYGLVQAAGEYLDHVRRARSWETKLGRTLIRPEPLKAKALTLVRELAMA